MGLMSVALSAQIQVCVCVYPPLACQQSSRKTHIYVHMFLNILGDLSSLCSSIVLIQKGNIVENP